MGNSDSKLEKYREHIGRLAGSKEIPLYSSATTSQAAAIYYQSYGIGNNGSSTLNRADSCASQGNGEGWGTGDMYSEFFSCLLREQFSAEDIYSLLSVQELRNISKANPRNYQNLVRFACFKICSLTTQLQSKQIEWSQFQDKYYEVIKCVRILTKIMGIFFELDKEQVLEDVLMWNRNSSEVLNLNARSASTTAATVGANLSSGGAENMEHPSLDLSPGIDDESSIKHNEDYNTERSPDSLPVAIGTIYTSEEVPPLGVLLLESCLKLLFMEGFTLPIHAAQDSLEDSSMHTEFYGQRHGKVSFSLWENGINTPDVTPVTPDPRLDSHRLEILRLILTLCSKNLYNPDALNKYLIVLASGMPEYSTVCFVSSMFNLVCRYCNNPEENQYPSQSYNSGTKAAQLNMLRKSLVMTSLSVLNILLCYNLPGIEKEDKKTYTFLCSLNIFPFDRVISHIPKTYLSSLNKEYDMSLIMKSLSRIIRSPLDIAVDQESNPFNWSSPSSAERRKSSGISGVYASQHNGSNNNNVTSNTTTGTMNIGTVTTPTNNTNNNNGMPASNRTSKSGSFSRSSSSSSNSCSSSYFNKLTPEIFSLNIQAVVLLWEMIKCNKTLENYVADKCANKLILFCVFYLKQYQDVPEYSSTLLPIIGGFATYLSSKKLVLHKMLSPIRHDYYTNRIPNVYKLSTGNNNSITFRDFCVINLSNLAVNCVKNQLPVRSYIFELLYNLLPIPSDFTGDDLVQLSSTKRNAQQPVALTYQASNNLLVLLSKMAVMGYISTPSSDDSCPSTSAYSYSQGSKLDNIALLLRAIVTYIVFDYQASINLLFAVCRHERIIYLLDTVIGQFSEGLTREQLRDLYAPDDRRMEMLLKNEIQNNDIPKNVLQGRLNSNISSINSQVPLVFDPYSAKDRNNDSICNENKNNLACPDLKDENSNDLNTTNGYRGSTDDGITTQAGKSTKIYEHVDYDFDVTLKNTKLYLALRSNWPVGLTVKGKWKTGLRKPLYEGWLGASSLALLIKIVKMTNAKFPQISQISSNEYYDLIAELGLWEKEFKENIKKELPPELKAMKNKFEPLQLDWEQNLIATKWYHSVIWGDIFTANSQTYNLSAFDRDSAKIANSQPSSANGYSERNLPGSTVRSRTNSNGSSFVNNIHDSEVLWGSIQPLMSPGIGSNPCMHVSTTSRDGLKDGTIKESTSSRSVIDPGTIFRLGWLGFSKGGSYIGSNGSEERSTRIPEARGNNSDLEDKKGKKPYNLDVGILKPNIWVGTDIKMFKVKTEMKEEFSLMEMTGSFFRNLKINSTPGPNNSEVPNLANGSISNIPSSTPVSRSARSSLLGLHSLQPTRATTLSAFK